MKERPMFGLVTAINIEDVPLIMRSAARNYQGNAEHDEKIILERTRLAKHHPELWRYAAELLQQCAKMLEEQIKEAQAHQPVKTPARRAVL
jgi:hypothetical protein